MNDFTDNRILENIIFGKSKNEMVTEYQKYKLDEIKFDGTYKMIDFIQSAMDSVSYTELYESCNTFLTDLDILQNGKIKVSMSKKDIILTDLIMCVVRIRNEITNFMREHDKTEDTFKNMTDVFKLLKFYLHKIKNTTVSRMLENIINIREEIKNLKIKLE